MLKFVNTFFGYNFFVSHNKNVFLEEIRHVMPLLLSKKPTFSSSISEIFLFKLRITLDPFGASEMLMKTRFE